MKFLLGVVAALTLDAVPAFAAPPGDTPPAGAAVPAPDDQGYQGYDDPAYDGSDDEGDTQDAQAPDVDQRPRQLGRQFGQRGRFAQQGGQGRGKLIERLKARFDVDRDGRLSPQERMSARMAIREHRLARFDRNGDGRLGPRERVMMRSQMFTRVIRRFDRNGDGQLGPGEAPPRLLQRLRRFDRNGDGWLTRDEVMVMRRRGGGRGGMGGRMGGAGGP